MSQQISSMAAKLAQELQVNAAQIEKAIQLLDAGDTVPFIARYRKDVTGNLDEVVLRKLVERLHYLRDLEERRQFILQSIREQGKLTEQLEKDILAAEIKTRLEDLYLPYRPNRRSQAQTAREAGLEPLAKLILENPHSIPEEVAKDYLNPEKEINEIQQAIDGARQIIMEQFAENPDVVNEVREYYWQHGILSSKGHKNKKGENNKYADYIAYAEPIIKIPSHRALALFRGRREGVLQLALSLPNDEEFGLNCIKRHFNLQDQGRSADAWLLDAAKNAWKVKLFRKIELELLARLHDAADEEAINVFARNLQGLLLAAPAGPKVTLGLDPGIRTGVKVVVVDVNGKLIDYTTVFPFAPQNEWHQAIAELAKLAARHQVNLVSIGNGTGCRDTERLVNEIIKMYPDLNLTKVVVNEAGASVYSASELGTEEFPDLDVSLRGAVSIARRLQDSLAELVKIEPKSIGVGQYQHDINEQRLTRCLDGVVEDCVNKVGVDVNTASVPLLMRVAGINKSVAKNLVAYRDTHGGFTSREELLKVSGMGEKTFQQAAGFLRIPMSNNPLDASAVHPEAYPLVEKILHSQGTDIRQVIGNHKLLHSINAADFVDDTYGLATIRDVLKELEKPGRDPRPEFRTVNYKEGVEEIGDLQVGMVLEGIVSNVTNFGAFVDVGVHQDGLVHISAMTTRFISDPHKVVKAGDIVQVKVVEVDKERRRIGLSMILEEKTSEQTKQASATGSSVPNKTAHAGGRKGAATFKKNDSQQKRPEKTQKKGVFNTAMADALAKLKESFE